MASVVEICSNALRSLGDDPITALTDDSDRARLCNALYPTVRDATLRAHPWNCAVVRSAFAKLASTPAWQFAAEYQLPTDPYCLRVLHLEDKTAPYKIEGRKLLTDLSSVNALYIKRITDPNEFDTLLYEALQWRLASRLAVPLKGSRTVAADFFQIYKDTISEAKTADGMESPRDAIKVTTLTDDVR